MEDTYVYISVKLNLKEGQTEETIQEVIQDMEYEFVHDDIIEHEIIDIMDMQIPEDASGLSELKFIDPYDLSGLV